MSIYRLLFGFVAAIIGLLAPIVEVSATTIRGNVFASDGITPLVASDNFTVVALAVDGTTTAFTITYPTVSSFNIEVNPALLPSTDKSVNLNIKLGSSVDRKLQGINGAATRMQTIDIGVTKPGTATNNVKSSIRGMLTQKDGVIGIPATLLYSVVAIDAGSNLINPMMGTSTSPPCPTYTFNLQASSIAGPDKTLRIEYRLGGVLDRVVEGVIANSTRVQTIDINYNTAGIRTMESQITLVNQSCDACDAPRHCEPRLRLGFLRGRCR
jgi:hypothetical protein